MVNGYKPFHNTANLDVDTYQLIYDPSIEAETTISNNKVVVWLATNDIKVEFFFRFDASNLKAGENREIKMLIPFPFPSVL
jgi:hypothetical protein